MCIRSFVLTLVAGLSLVTTTAQAQGTAPGAGNASAQPAATQHRTVPIAVIDLGYILNNHPTMKQEIEQIKAESESVGALFEKKRQAILKQMAELRDTYTEGTAEYSKKEAEIAASDTAFRLDVVRQNKVFDEKRAQIFYTVHTQVAYLCKYYCDARGTFAVLNVMREKPDPKKPQTIETAMMQGVFYYQQSDDVDITNWVLQQLKANASPGQPAAQTNTARAPGAGGAVVK